eukprot:gene13578-13703_t
MDMLGTEYVVGDFGIVDFGFPNMWTPWIQLVAADVSPTTNITVTTSHITTLGPPGTYNNITMAALDALVIRPEVAGEGLGGTRIIGSAPFAVIAGHTGAQLPPPDIWSICESRGLLLEQLPPTYSWGKQFLVTTFTATPNLPPTVPACLADHPYLEARFKQLGDVVQVVADHDFTELRTNGEPIPHLLAAGQSYSFVLPHGTTAYITATKPVMVMQLMESRDARGGQGDPSMTGQAG